jgi:hypothetical protein
MFTEPYGQRSACFTNVASATFTDVICRAAGLVHYFGLILYLKQAKLKQRQFRKTRYTTIYLFHKVEDKETNWQLLRFDHCRVQSMGRLQRLTPSIQRPSWHWYSTGHHGGRSGAQHAHAGMSKWCTSKTSNKTNAQGLLNISKT